MRFRHLIGVVLLVLSLAGCSGEANLPVYAGTGPNPELPPPASRLIPTVNIAPARGWPTGRRPTAAEGTPVVPFADNLDHPLDERVEPQRPDLVAQAIAPDYALGPHTVCLGLVSSRGTRLPGRFANGMSVGQHGSWNRVSHSGYKVIFVPFSQGKPCGAPLDLLTGFLSAEGKALGRPVGVATDKQGALLVADDVGNIIWRVTSCDE